MSTKVCPSPELLARFAHQQAAPEEWRAVVRHLSDCDLCRRQAALVAEEIPADLPLGSEVVPALKRSSTRAWPRVVAVAAAALLLGGIVWALLRVPAGVPAPEPPPSSVRNHPAPPPPRDPAPLPAREEPLPERPLKTPPPPAPEPAPKEVAVPEKPAPPKSLPPPSTFIVERTRSAVSQAIEVVLDQGLMARVTPKGPEPLGPRSTVQPSETLTSSAGGSLLLPDGSALHLAPEAEVRVSWSQSLSCATVDLRSGDAVVDLGPTPKPLFVSHQATGVQLVKSVGRVFVSLDQGSLRATLLTGTAEVPTKAGGTQALASHQSLVLRETGDAVEKIEKPDVSRFSTLDPAAKIPPGVAPPKPGAEPRAPDLDVLALGLAAQSYSYRVSGREVRDGVWSPSGIYTSTIESVTAARRADDTDVCHFQRGNRPWDELGKMAPGSRDAHLVDLLRGLKVPHQLVAELASQVSGAGVPRTEKVRDRICLIWELKYAPDALRKAMETSLESASADGRLQKPDYVYWDTLEGSLEAASLKFEPRLMRLVDRRKVAYSYKTVSGLDRRTYQLETTMEFFSHGVAAFPLSPDLVKRLKLQPQ